MLEEVAPRGCAVTLDALHAARDTARPIVEVHGTDYVLAVKANCPDTFAQLAAVDWDTATTCCRRRSGRSPTPARRSASCASAPDAKTVETSSESGYGITSVAASRAGSERLLAWNRGHWQVENGNHLRRDASMGENARCFRAATHRSTTPSSTTSCSRSSSTTASAT